MIELESRATVACSVCSGFLETEVTYCEYDSTAHIKVKPCKNHCKEKSLGEKNDN